MKKTLILLIVVWLVAAILGVLTPWGMQHIIQNLAVLAIAGVVFGFFFLIARAIDKGARARSNASFWTEGLGNAGMWSAKSLVLFFIAVLSETAWFILCDRINSGLLAEVGCYLILLILGYALSSWCKSKRYVPVLMVIFLILVHSIWETVQFMHNPSAQYQFGPEIVIFAASQIAGQLAMLPLDASVVWGGWSIAEAIKRRTHKALDAESQPVSEAN